MEMRGNPVHTIAEQLRHNTVALVSLFVAFTALGYNTWRNEVTEFNRNQRAAGFEILAELAALQLTADLLHYGDADAGERDSPIRGWARVILIRDLARIMSPDCQGAANNLHAAWQSNWSGLGERESATEAITRAIDDMRRVVLVELRALE